MNKIPDSELETIYNRFKNRKVTKDTLTSIGRDYKVSHVAIKNAIERYENQLKHKKVSNESSEVTKEKKVQRQKSRKSTLEHEKELIKFRWLLENKKDKYLLLDALEEYKIGKKNSTYRLTEACLSYIKKNKDDRKELRILINKELK